MVEMVGRGVDDEVDGSQQGSGTIPIQKHWDFIPVTKVPLVVDMVRRYTTSLVIPPIIVAIGSRELDPGYFWARLGRRTISASDFEAMDDAPDACLGLLHSIADRFDRDFVDGKQDRMEGWKEILSKLGGFRSSFLQGRVATSLCSPLRRCLWSIIATDRTALPHDLNNAASHLLLDWVQFLYDSKVDLFAYGRYEEKGIMQDPSVYVRLMRGTVVCRVIKLAFGKLPAEWRIWLSTPYDEVAHEFWNWQENPELFIPGSWPAEDLDDDDSVYGDYTKSCDYWWGFISSRRRRKRLIRYMHMDPERGFQKCWVAFEAEWLSGDLPHDCHFCIICEFGGTSSSSLCPQHGTLPTVYKLKSGPTYSVKVHPSEPDVVADSREGKYC